MELRLLRAFVAVAEELHFGRAAQRLHIAQPALSQQIKHLEAEVGTVLLRRTTRSVALTDAGRVLLDDARDLLHRDALALQRARRAAAGEVGRLTIGFVDSAAYELLPRVLRRVADRAPDVELDLRELSTEPQLASLQDECDVGILRELEAADGLHVVPLLRESLMAALPVDHACAGLPEIELARLADESFVLFPRPHVPLVHDHLVAVCRAAGFLPRVAQHALQYTTMLGLVSAGFGVALVPTTVAALRRTDVSLVPLCDAHAVSRLSLAWRHDADSASLPAFVDTAREVAEELEASAMRGGARRETRTIPAEQHPPP